MKILMMTNTYLPHVGGVARSVQRFTDAYRARGHEVLVIAPTFADAQEDEPGVMRVKAIEDVFSSGFSMALPVPARVREAVEDFGPDIVHSHHPILLGDTALRLAATHDVPIVFTHHTMYEHYTHYYPGDSEPLRRFVSRIATGYANLCDMVFAPSESVAHTIRGRGVTAPIEVVPTGVDVAAFADGDGRRARRRWGVPENAFVVGHLGRLAPEKNLDWMAGAILRFAAARPDIHVLIAGKGPSMDPVRARFQREGLDERLTFTGSLSGQDLVDAYHAMDVFAFASKSETQGMVVTEAMAAGVPVVGLDAPGVREVVIDRQNGRLVTDETQDAFSEALTWVADRQAPEAEALRRAARETAERFSIDATADRALGHYRALAGSADRRSADADSWSQLMRRLETEWAMLTAAAEAMGAAFTDEEMGADLR